MFKQAALVNILLLMHYFFLSNSIYVYKSKPYSLKKIREREKSSFARTDIIFRRPEAKYSAILGENPFER